MLKSINLINLDIYLIYNQNQNQNQNQNYNN